VVHRFKFLGAHIRGADAEETVDPQYRPCRLRQSYRTYLERVQREWSATPEDRSDRIRERPKGPIGAEPTAGYPSVNKIVEMNLIGRRARGQDRIRVKRDAILSQFSGRGHLHSYGCTPLVQLLNPGRNVRFDDERRPWRD